METVEVVIRIPKREVEEIKRYCKRVELKISSLEDYIYRSIANGTVLPKGHGDLVDKDELLKDTCTAELWDGREEEVIWESTIKLVPIVIEADKEVEHG